MTENVSFRGNGWFGWLRRIPVLNAFVERRHERLSTLQFVEQLARTDVAPSLRAMNRAQRQRALTAAAYEFERFGDSQSTYFQSRARVLSVVFAMIFAFAANIDALQIYKRLHADAELRAIFSNEQALAQLERESAAAPADDTTAQQALSDLITRLDQAQNQGLPVGYVMFPHCQDSPALAVDHGSPVTVSTPGGSISAKYAILACDSEIGGLEPRFRQVMMPVINYNVTTRPLSEAEAAGLIPSNASIAESRFVLNYYRLTADNRLLFGGGEKYSPRPPRDIKAFVRPHIERIFPQLTGVELDHAWGGTIGVTFNRLPHFGRIGNSFYAQGYSGHGVLLTTLAGELIAEAMRGTAERFDLMANLPMRKFPGGPLLRHPLYVLGMLWYALKDRL